MRGEPLHSYQREIDVLDRLHHKNIIKLLNSEKAHRKNKTGMTFAMTFELCPLDLKQILNKMAGTRLPLNTIKNISKQLLQGLQYLHQNHVLHRDLKIDNLLITANGTLKIADFGLARFESPEKTYTPDMVTVAYRAPEVLLSTTNYGPAMDMWSVGCIIAGIFIGRRFIRGQSEIDVLHYITVLLGTITQEKFGDLHLPLLKSLRMPINDFPKLKKLLSKKVQNTDTVDLLCKLLSLNPNDRPDYTDALAHPFIASTPGTSEATAANLTSELFTTSVSTSSQATAAQSSCASTSDGAA